MANRFPGQQPNNRPADNVMPTMMGGPSASGLQSVGMQQPMFRPLHQTGAPSWNTLQQSQQNTMGISGGFGPLATVSASVKATAPQVAPQTLAGRDRNYLQQQQKLRAMASSFKKPGPLSADSLIEDLLQQKETFTMRPHQFPTTTDFKSNPSQDGLDRSKQHPSTKSHLGAGVSSGEVAPGLVCGPGNIGTAAGAMVAPPFWLSPDAYDLLPAVYRRVWELTKVVAADGRELVDTGRIFSILLTSGLPRDALGYIWNLSNTVIPGVLTRPELNVALALVALAQTGWRNFTSSAVLSMVQQPPVPNLQLEAVAMPAAQNQAPPVSMPAATNQALSSFIPVNLSSPLTTQAFRDSAGMQEPNLIPLVTESQTNLNNMKDTKILTPDSNYTVKPQLGLLDDNDDFTDFQSAAPTQNLVTDSQLSQPAVAELSKSSFFNPRDSPLGFNSFESPPASPVSVKPKGTGSREVGSRLANYSFGLSAAPTAAPNLKRNLDEVKEDIQIPMPLKIDDSLFPKCAVKPPPQDKPSASSGFLKESIIRSDASIEKVTPSLSKAAQEDKYSALRGLAFGDNLESESVEPPPIDDFGDFLSAGVSADDSFAELATREQPTTTTTFPIPSLEVSSTEPQEWSANFDTFSSSGNTFSDNTSNAFSSTDDTFSSTSNMFSSINNTFASTSNSYTSTIAFSSASNTLWGEEPNISVLPATECSGSQAEDDEEDFGDFVGPSTISSLPHLNRLRESSAITPDTQSVASLELGGFDNLSLGGAAPGGSSPDGGLPELRGALEGVQWEAAATALQEEGREWRQCLHSCLALLQAAAQILGAIDDPHVAEEVVSSREGEDYLANLLEVYCVTQRISAASHQLLPASRHSLEPLLAEVELAWCTLSPFLERSNIEMKKDKKWTVSSGNSAPCCALCLVLVEDTEGSTALVRSGQHCYHASCANLWLNCVDGLLPTMSVP